MKPALLRVLMYHRVLDPSGHSGNPAIVSATPRDFDRQMRHLALRYCVVSSEEALTAIRERRQLPRRAVLLTFDDGYWDFGVHAWPILRRYRLPATLFIPTAYPGNPQGEFWWDRLFRAAAETTHTAVHSRWFGRIRLGSPAERRAAARRIAVAVKTLPHAAAMAAVDEVCSQMGTDGPRATDVLSWQDLRVLVGDGLTVGAHTRTHPILTRIPVEQARAEMVGARDDIMRELGNVTSVMAYPAGSYESQVVQAARDAGVEMAFTGGYGENWLPGTDPLRLFRTNVSLRTTDALFRFRLTRCGSFVDQWRHRHHHGGARARAGAVSVEPSMQSSEGR